MGARAGWHHIGRLDTGSFTLPLDALALIRTQDSAVVTLTRRNVGQTSSSSADLQLVLAVESRVFRSVTLTP
jgi:hypothetical protein